jgi:hypothetical protein
MGCHIPKTRNAIVQVPDIKTFPKKRYNVHFAENGIEKPRRCLQ